MVKRMIEEHCEEHDITIVKIQNAVTVKERFPGRLLALEDDVQKRSVSPNVPMISYHDLLNLIFQNDRILCW